MAKPAADEVDLIFPCVYDPRGRSGFLGGDGIEENHKRKYRQRLGGLHRRLGSLVDRRVVVASGRSFGTIHRRVREFSAKRWKRVG